ncbi:MAG TPA: hypothetical protein VMI54_03790 [Polyangiaceae bacterium]|nr:hypothetical protein [Polyangiaceae bacterium]
MKQWTISPHVPPPPVREVRTWDPLPPKPKAPVPPRQPTPGFAGDGMPGEPVPSPVYER